MIQSLIIGSSVKPLTKMYVTSLKQLMNLHQLRTPTANCDAEKLIGWTQYSQTAEVAENLRISTFKVIWLNNILVSIIVPGHKAVGNSRFWLVDVWPIG